MIQEETQTEAIPGGKMTEGTPWEDAVPGDLLSLDGPTRRRLERLCRKGVESWINDSGPHHANLRRWNEHLEGVIEDIDYPWEGASELHIPLIAMHVVTLHSVMARSLLSVDPLWHLKTNDTELRNKASDIEQGINYEVKSELNLVEAVRDVLYTTPRDGLGWIHGWWAHETTPIEDVIYVESRKQFSEQFPDAESAGMEEEDYEATLKEIEEANPTKEVPYKVRRSYDRVDYHGPKFEVVDEANFVRAPMTAKTLDDCRVYGPRKQERCQSLLDDAKAGRLWLSIVKGWAASGRKGEESGNDWLRGQEDIEGISRSSGDNFTDERETFLLVVRFKKEPEDREVKVLCTYSHDKKKLLGASKYPYTKDCFFGFRIRRRPGRMIGVAVPEILEDMNDGLDKSIRYEENCTILEQAPMFKGKKKLKDRGSDWDPSIEPNWFGPGKIAWVDDPSDFTNFDIKQSSKQDSKLLRQEIMRYAEMLVGPTQLLSGRESPTDPNAPGNKTIALIQQSNMRIEDYLNEFRLGFDALGDFVLELYRQFGPKTLRYIDKHGNQKELEREWLNGNGKMSAHGVTVTISPEVEFVKATQKWVLLKDEPMVGGDPVRRRELLSDLMVSGRFANREALLPPLSEVQKAEDAKRDQEAEKRVITKLVQAGVIPPPAPPPGAMPPGGMAPGGVPSLPPVPAGVHGA